MENLKMTLIQSDLDWEDPVLNRKRFRRVISSLRANTDLILLPEMFPTGFSNNPWKFSEVPGGPTEQFLSEMASRKQCAIAGSVITRDHGRFYNRLIFCYPDGTVKKYDKRHLFRLSEEFRLFSAGNKRVVVSYKGWNILLQVCYDLRFPVWSKNTWKNNKYEYDLALYLANWPDSRAHVWNTLLAARAMENQAYVAGVNRIGMDGNNTFHGGDSVLYTPKGTVLWKAPYGKASYHTVELNAMDLSLFRQSFTVGMDWDTFTLK
jgi:predicted amidohydrolase